MDCPPGRKGDRCRGVAVSAGSTVMSTVKMFECSNANSWNSNFEILIATLMT